MANSPRAVTVRTREIRPGDPSYHPPLPELPPTHEPVSWIRDGDGLVGWGELDRVHTSGPARFAEADRWWRSMRARMGIDDEVRIAGTGPVAFASLSFDADPGTSVITIPRVVVGQRNGVRWITTVGDYEPESAPPIRRPGTIRYGDGHVASTAYRAAVAESVRRMREPGGASKIVLAHDLLAATSRPLDSRFLLRNLATRHPNCWTFAVDGLVGATPELLLRREGSDVHSQVLAGTTWPRDSTDAELLAKELLSSAKNQREHVHAVNSLATSLRPFCEELSVSDAPEVLRLRNVMHLASTVSGRLERSGDAESTLLRLVGAVHPTAAVGGTPTEQAVRLIGELEGMDRGRYAGPVGWVDGADNGEFGIALRCARIEDPGGTDRASTLRLFAGCGIVADSDPDEETAEAQAKLLPIREALEGLR
ncbi:isochorismate synthase [Halosaccharopolyspora lacisalsi]|uniref:isochorismate synthase n=1 Tax=Halosaccharopolyspora lacisalsi TaxID=1000566 RepID=UPI002E2D21CF|nr:isochorismate synthase [Halosaccharopolyspora lacisalsi]